MITTYYFLWKPLIVKDGRKTSRFDDLPFGSVPDLCRSSEVLPIEIVLIFDLIGCVFRIYAGSDTGFKFGAEIAQATQLFRSGLSNNHVRARREEDRDNASISCHGTNSFRRKVCGHLNTTR
jgi:hypothetical protein